MPRYLLTQSLLASWQYQFDCAEGQEDKAAEDFLRVLRREPTETTEAMQNGIDFENAINSYLKDDIKTFDERWGYTHIAIAEIVRGAQSQVVAYKEKTIAGVDFMLYARCDFVRAGRIIDTKFVRQYEVGKYFESPQHPMYFECIPQAHEFVYLVSDGKDMYKERYARNEVESIDRRVENFITYLIDAGLLNLYYEKWEAKHGT